MDDIIEYLYSNQDLDYRDFNSSLIPSVDKNLIIGVRTPILRNFAKVFKNTILADNFMNELPHKYFEENQIHIFLINEIRDYDLCITEIEQILPYIDNWATCDQLSPKIMKKYPEKNLSYIFSWLESNRTYTIRFAIKRLMDIYLDVNFKPEYPKMISEIKTNERYINLAIAWYFATALAKQYDTVLPYIENHILSDSIHKATIQKACESYRVTDKHKMYLKSLL